MSRTRRYVAVSAIVSFAVLFLAAQKKSGALPTPKQLIGYGFVFFILSAGADLGFEAAGAFALLAMTSIFLELGPDALAFLGVRGGTPNPLGPTPNVITNVRRGPYTVAHDSAAPAGPQGPIR